MSSVDSKLPLSPAAFHILLALAEREQHGYAIMQEAIAAGMHMGPGTLYATIKRLLDHGLIEEATNSVRADDDERRRYYRITPPGRRLLGLEAARLAALVDRAAARGLLPTSGSGRRAGAR